MKQGSRLRSVVVACAIALTPVLTASAQLPPGAVGGRTTFGTYCASCHGSAAKGDGTLASMMNPRPPDLTLIAKRAGGAFPAERVARTIDGRTPAKGHGNSEMPVWGDAFAKSRADSGSTEEKIQQLVSYLESIQVKP